MWIPTFSHPIKRSTATYDSVTTCLYQVNLRHSWSWWNFRHSGHRGPRIPWRCASAIRMPHTTWQKYHKLSESIYRTKSFDGSYEVWYSRFPTSHSRARKLWGMPEVAYKIRTNYHSESITPSEYSDSNFIYQVGNTSRAMGIFRLRHEDSQHQKVLYRRGAIVRVPYRCYILRRVVGHLRQALAGCHWEESEAMWLNLARREYIL